MPPTGDIPDGFVAIARITGARGVHGEVKAEPLAPAEILAPGRTVTVAGNETRIDGATGDAGRIRLKLAGIDDREAAAALSGSYVLVAEDELPPLPEDQYYRFQLLGMLVVSVEGEELGVITDVFSTPENDVYVVRRDGPDILIPATDDIVQEVDLGARRMTVEVVPGLLP
jgi:16S rRNA processing protein RimM